MQALLKFLRPAARMPTENAVTFVNNKIKSNKVVVFSKTYCPYCVKAKKALASLVKPEEMEVVELDSMQPGGSDPTIIEIQDALFEVTGARSVPRVFVGGEFLGGGDDTAAMAANGQLAAKLQAISA